MFATHRFPLRMMSNIDRVKIKDKRRNTLIAVHDANYLRSMNEHIDDALTLIIQ